jgi:hypothetical protein
LIEGRKKRRLSSDPSGVGTILAVLLQNALDALIVMLILGVPVEEPACQQI